MPDSDRLSRDELLEARAKVKQQITELGYACVAGIGTSQKGVLRKRLREILAEIEQELEELDSSNR